MTNESIKQGFQRFWEHVVDKFGTFEGEYKDNLNAVLRKLNSKVDKPTEDEAMVLLAEMNIITPTVDNEGAVLTDENGNIFVI